MGSATTHVGTKASIVPTRSNTIRYLQITLAGLLLLALLACSGLKSTSTTSTTTSASSSSSAEQSNKEKIVGVWEFVKSSDGERAPAGFSVTVQFTSDGKMKKTETRGPGQQPKIEQGTYTVTGDSLNASFKDDAITFTIKKLTDTQLIISNVDKGTLEFQKK